MGILVSKATTATVTFSTPQQIIISHLDDSIRIGDGTDLADVTSANALKTDSSHVTQPVSAASLPLPTGAATEAKQTQPGVDIGDVTINNAAGAAAVNIQDGGNSITVDGAVSATQGTSPWAVSGTVAATQSGTWNITDISGTVSLPTGAATADRQDTGNASLSSIDGKVSTATKQDTGNTSLSSIDTKLTTTNASLATIDAGIPAGLGATTASASMPVTLSTDGYPYVQSPDGASTAIPTASVLTQSFSGTGFGTYINTNGAASMAIHGSGTWNALIAVYGSNDGGTTNQALPMYAFTNGSIQTFLQTDNSGQIVNIGGWKQVVIRCVTYTSGAPIAIKYWFNAGAGPMMVMSQLAIAFKTQANLYDSAGSGFTKGQTTMTGSLPVVIASDQSAIATTNAALALAQGSTTSGQTGPLAQGAVTTAAPSYTTAQTSPLSLTTSGGLRTDTSAIAGTTTSTNNGTSDAGTQRVTIASNSTGQIALATGSATIGALTANQSVNVAQIAATTTAVNAGSTSAGTQRVLSATGATGTQTSTAASATNVTLLAANTSRLGVIIYNDGNADLKIKFGATASATSFAVFIPKNTGYEMWAPCYNGIIDGIWSSATGNARVTEIT